MTEVLLELHRVRCPRCAGELVLRVTADERAGAVHLALDTACASCGVSPWNESDERVMVFRPGSPIGVAISDAAADYAAVIAAAQGRVDALLQKVGDLERDLEQARRSVNRASAEERRRKQELESELRSEISRLEGSLAEARAEVRKADEATRGAISPGKRAIELE
jgi:RNase P subunit RPR2